MNEIEILNRLRESVVNCQIEEAKKAAEDAIKADIPALEIVDDGIVKGLNIVGGMFERNERWIMDLFASSEAAKQAMDILTPHLNAEERVSAGTVVIGTVEGDIHDLGKNLVATLLGLAGFTVRDLGVDVSGEAFAEEIERSKPEILGMSALLTTTMSEMETVIKTLEKKGLREQVKVIVGGTPVTSNFADSIGADAYGNDAVEGTNICKRWVVEISRLRAK